MVKLKFNQEEIKELLPGIEIISKIRGFELSDNGLPVHVKSSADGLAIAEKNGEYYIEYSRRNEFFRATSMLVGLICTDKTMFDIRQKASFEMCGVMFDCSRGAVLKTDMAIDFIARCAMMGMDTFMLYTEDVYELEGYEYFGYMRGRYTKAQLKKINLVADSLGIELIPCIQTLGHLLKALRWSYAKDIKDVPDVLLIDEEKTYELIEAMFKAWREVCPSKKIHIGMDEAEGVGLGEYMNRHGACDRFDIMSRHVNRVCQIAEKYGFEPMMWSDMFFKIGSKKRDYYDLNTQIPDDLHKKIPDGVSMVYWDYYHEDKNFYKTMLENHKKLGSNIIFAGGVWTWRGLCPQYQKTYDTTYPALEACCEAGIKNVIATIWRDDGANVSPYTMLPGIELFAEFNYCGRAPHEALKENFFLCTGYDLEAFEALDFDNIPAKKKDALATSKQVLLEDILCGLFDKNFACYDLEDYYSGIINKLGNLKNQGDLEYLFDYYRTLAKILKKKCMLGVKIRKAYKERSTQLLRKYIVVLDELYNDYQRLDDVLYDLWSRENKPFGFEIFEENIGGMLLRFKTAGKKLSAFCSGDISRIEELDEELLWYGGDESCGELLSNHFMSEMRVYINEE